MEEDGYRAGLARRNRTTYNGDLAAWFEGWKRGKAERLERLRRREIFPRDLADEMAAYYGGRLP